MRFLTVIFACFLVFSAATFCLADSAETPNQVEVKQGENTQKVAENSQSADSSGNKKKDVEDLSGDSVPGYLLSLEVERQLSERIRKISEDARRRERPNYTFSCLFGYTDHGVDEVLPEHFFRGHLISQGISFSHRAGFRIAIENFTSISGGGFSDLGDRTVLDAKVWKKFGPLYGAVQHRWVHTNYKVDEDFFLLDRHRTAVRLGLLIGPLQPYAFISSDLPANTLIDEMAGHGGGGIDLRFPIDQLNTEIYLGASVAGSLFLYNRDGAALYRACAGFAISLGGIVVNPEVLFLRGVFRPDDLLVTSLRFAF